MSHRLSPTSQFLYPSLVSFSLSLYSLLKFPVLPIQVHASFIPAPIPAPVWNARSQEQQKLAHITQQKRESCVNHDKDGGDNAKTNIKNKTKKRPGDWKENEDSTSVLECCEWIMYEPNVFVNFWIISKSFWKKLSFLKSSWKVITKLASVSVALIDIFFGIWDKYGWSHSRLRIILQVRNSKKIKNS